MDGNNITAFPQQASDAFWVKLIRQYGAGLIKIDKDGEPLSAIDKANLLYFRLCDRYFEGGILHGGNGVASAMKSLQKYLAATAIKDHPEAKHIRRLFKIAISVAAKCGPEKDGVQLLCFLIAMWAEDAGLDTTTLRVKSDGAA